MSISSQSHSRKLSFSSNSMNEAPDAIDQNAEPFHPFTPPSCKLDSKERMKYYSENKTSDIGYPKGIPDIEKYLVNLSDEVKNLDGQDESMSDRRKPEEILVLSYQEQSKLIQEGCFTKPIKFFHNNFTLPGNILSQKCYSSELDQVSPIQKNYHDGGKYYGTLQNGLRHGFGKYYFNNGDIYEGIHGEGIYYYQNGEVYRGMYRLGQRQGHGSFNYLNGDRYEGDWKNGNIEGVGIYNYSIGEIYIGEYKENKRNGDGRYIYKNGIIYHGYWDNGNQRGVGCYIYGNGVYMGECELGFRHGKGIYLFKDGSSYEGSWIKGKREGWGVYKYANGSKYQRNQSLFLQIKIRKLQNIPLPFLNIPIINYFKVNIQDIIKMDLEKEQACMSILTEKFLRGTGKKIRKTVME